MSGPGRWVAGSGPAGGRAASATPPSAITIATSFSAPMLLRCSAPSVTGTIAPSAPSGATIDIGPSSAAR